MERVLLITNRPAIQIQKCFQHKLYLISTEH